MSNEPGVTPEPTPQAPPAPTVMVNPVVPAVTPPGATPNQPTDTAAIIRDLEARLASANAHVETLKSENIQRRKDGKIAEDDRAALESYRALGKPDELKARLESGDKATQEAATLKRQQAQAAAAALLKLKPSALSEKWLGEGVPVIEGEGEAQKVVIVDGETRTAWDDFVKANADLAEVLPALKLEPGTNGASGQAWGGAAAHGKQAAPGFDEDKARASQAGLYRDF